MEGLPPPRNLGSYVTAKLNIVVV